MSPNPIYPASKEELLALADVGEKVRSEFSQKDSMLSVFSPSR
jgi:hypothetical protein